MAGQINAFLKRAFKYAFCTKIYTIGVSAEVDKLLFKKVMSANHCVHCIHFISFLLSPAGIASELKDMSSPDVTMNYIKSLLFLDVCIEIVTVKQSAHCSVHCHCSAF